jgi:hypothetical protein
VILQLPTWCRIWAPKEPEPKIIEGALGDPAAERAARVSVDGVERLAKAAAIRFVVRGDDKWPDGLDDLGRAESIQSRDGEPMGARMNLNMALAELAIVLVNREQLRQPGPPRQVSSSRSTRAASDAQTASGQAHSPTLNQGAPWSKRGAPPATAHTPATTHHHRGQPTRQRRTSTTRPESVR